MNQNRAKEIESMGKGLVVCESDQNHRSEVGRPQLGMIPSVALTLADEVAV